MVDWPVALVLNNSVTGSDSEESLTALGREWLHLGGLDGDLGVDLLDLLLILEFVEVKTLVHLPVLEEHVEGGLSNWNHVLQDVPEDSL